MEGDPALCVLVQGVMAELVRALRRDGRPENASDVLAGLSAPLVHAEIASHVRRQTPARRGHMVDEARARVDADLMLSRCDAQLDAMERDDTHRCCHFTMLDGAARLLSETLRHPSSVERLLQAIGNADAALRRLSVRALVPA